MTHEIKTANACYSGGGIYIYYGQLESGLYFRANEDFETIYVCDANASVAEEEANWPEFYEQHTVEEITGEAFVNFWNRMLTHIINGGPSFDEWNNYSKSELESEIIPT